MEVVYFLRLALVSVAIANIDVNGKVIKKVSSSSVQDKGGAYAVSTSVTTEDLTYAEDGGAANNISQSVKLINVGVESSANISEEPSFYEGNSVSVSSKNFPDSKSAIVPIVVSEVNSTNAGSKSRENATESEVESSGKSNSSEVGSGEKIKPYGTETVIMSNDTEQGSYGVPKVSVKDVSVDKSVSGVQTTTYDTQPSALTIESNSILGDKGKGASTSNSKEKTSSKAGSNEQITSSEVESYERSNGSIVESTNQLNSSVTAPSEQVKVTGSEMEFYDQSNVSVATSSEQLTGSEVESYNQSNGSGAGSTNQSSSSNVVSQSNSTSLDIKSYNKSTELDAETSGKSLSSYVDASLKSKGSGTGSSRKPDGPGLNYNQEPNVRKYAGVSAGSNYKAKSTLNVDSNKKRTERRELPIGKTLSSKIVSNIKPNNAVTRGTETGKEQVDVETSNIGQPGGKSEVAEGTVGLDAGEQPEGPEGIQLGPCARYPFRTEGSKVIFDVELNCQLSVDIDVAKQIKRYGQKGQGKAAVSSLFEMQTLSGRKAVDGTCPKLETFLSSRGNVHIKTSSNCHIIVYPDRVSTGTKDTDGEATW